MHDPSWLTWPKDGCPTAARDIPEGTLIFTEHPQGCASLYMLGQDAPGNRLFPQHASIVRPVHNEAPINMHAELARSLRLNGITEENVHDHLHVDPGIEEEHDTMTAAVLGNEVPMVCMFTGLQYGLAVCSEIARMKHDCLPDTEVFFGEEGRAHVCTVRKVAAGSAVTISFMQHHHTAAMCSCRRRQLARGISESGCTCDTCTGWFGDAEEKPESECTSCVHKASLDLQRTDPEAYGHVFDPFNYMDLLSKAPDYLPQFLRLWGKHKALLLEHPYMLNRFARQILLSIPDISEENDVYARLQHDVALACEKWVTTRSRSMVRAGALHFMGVNNKTSVDPAETLALIHQAAVTWTAEVVAIYPWTESFVTDFCAVPLIMQPKMREFVERAWDVRDIDPSDVIAGAQAVVLAHSVPNLPADLSKCTVCGKDTSSHCGRCGLWSYCSKQCQKSAWEHHRDNECRPKLSVPLTSVDMIAVPYAWEAWPLRSKAIASYPKKGLSILQQALHSAASKSGCTEDVHDTSRNDALANEMAMLRFMNPICKNDACKNTTRTDLRACTKCALVYYCNDTCAKAHWKQHRLLCCNPEASEF